MAGIFKEDDDHVRTKSGKLKFSDKEFREVVVSARTAYRALGTVKRNPTIDEIDAVCTVPMHKIAKIISTESFVKAMTACGINWKQSKGLSAKQQYVLAILTDPNNRRTFESRLKMAGVTNGEYQNWMKQPLFASLINNFSEQAITDHMAQVHNSLLNQADKGNMAAITLYYAMTGRYNPQSQTERDINSVLVQVIDIIQRAGLDQDKLELIAGELKALMSGSVKSDQRELTSFRSEREDLEYSESVVNSDNVVDVEEIEDELPKVEEFSFGD